MAVHGLQVYWFNVKSSYKQFNYTSQRNSQHTFAGLKILNSGSGRQARGWPGSSPISQMSKYVELNSSWQEINIYYIHQASMNKLLDPSLNIPKSNDYH